MLFAAIDIGSNAARLLFSNVYEHRGQVHVSKASLTRVPTRLGEDVYKKDKTIGKKRSANFLKTMKAFSLLIDVYKPVGVKVCATAAMREATNSVEIIEKVKKKTGLSITTIDGQEEAELIRNGVKSIFASNVDSKLFIDVGGGSTELSIEHNNKLLCQKSFRVGTLRLLNGQTKDTVWEDITNWLAETSVDFSRLQIIGTGGNINKINKTFGNIHTKSMHFNQLEDAYRLLNAMTVEERIQRFGFRNDRADVIVPAAKIYHFIMQHIQATEIFVPKLGLADGLILKQYETYNSY